MDDFLNQLRQPMNPAFLVESIKENLKIINAKLAYVQELLQANIENKQPENAKYYYKLGFSVEKRQEIWRNQRGLLLKKEALETKIKEMRGIK